jgi:protein SCO1/2
MRRQKEKGQRQKWEHGALAKRPARRPGFARALAAALLLLPTAYCLLPTASAQYGRPPEHTLPQGGRPAILKQVGIEQKLDSQLPLDAVFRDESGREVRLGEYFAKGKPVVLSLVYYECPMMCNEILNSLAGSLVGLQFSAGKEFEVVTVSFDAREQPPLAAAKKAAYLRRYGRPGAEQGWHFLTGEQGSIDDVAEAAGFNYVWDEESKQFAHSAAIMVATPGGRLSHYFYGIDYQPKDIRLALVEASSGKIGSPVDKIILYCYHYDPVTGKYGPVVLNIVRVAGVVTVLLLVVFFFVLRRRRRAYLERVERWDGEIDVGGAA